MLISSILIYLIFALTMYALAYNAKRFVLNRQDFTANILLIIAVFVFSIISGLRYRVGVDCEMYAESYKLLLDGADISKSEFLGDVEVGFLYISKFIAMLQMPRFVYMGFWAFLEIGLLTLAFRRRVALLPMIYLLLILGPYYLSFMNGVRQSVVSCVFVLAIQSLLDDRNWGKYIIFILLSCLIHRSAILLLPLFAVMFYNKRPNVFLCLILLAVCTIVGQMPFVKEYLQMTQLFLEFLDYSTYAENMDYYVDLDATITSFGPRRMILFVTNILVILFSNDVSKRCKNDRLYNVSFLFFMIYSCGSELLVSVDILFARPLLYFFPFVLICESYTMWYLLKSNKVLNFGLSKIKMGDIAAKLICMVTLLFFSSYTILDNIAEMSAPTEYSLFKFIFFH